MAIFAKFTRYDTSIAASVDIEEFLPTHVTITGKENHFATAYHDAEMFIKGMRALDKALGLDHRADPKTGKVEPVNIIYSIRMIAMDR